MPGRALAPVMPRRPFPDLASFMGGWFHQDSDLHGDSLEEVVAAFKAESDAALVAPLVDDFSLLPASPPPPTVAWTAPAPCRPRSPSPPRCRPRTCCSSPCVVPKA
ncbi:contact-dependent growth inhibition system immunity protein [Pseudorhodoferax sp. LjRoot39]|uniref:contact-dependent growth inhibition system immunity protein n=1 Tax=Pseudorhodoferax sp. LjRoot39 TaxID=3342328 RepID=UPI003F4FCB24